MTKTKLKRYIVRRLYAALNVCRTIDVPSKFRYAIERNTTSLQSEIEAINKAWPEPDLFAALSKVQQFKARPEGEQNGDLVDAEKEFQDVKAKHDAWEKEVAEPFEESVEVDLYMTDLIEIDDTVNVSKIDRARQNQALINALMPVWKD